MELELAVGEGGIGLAVAALGHRMGGTYRPVVGPWVDPGLLAVEPLLDIEQLVSRLSVVGFVLFLVSFWVYCWRTPL